MTNPIGLDGRDDMAQKLQFHDRIVRLSIYMIHSRYHTLMKRAKYSFSTFVDYPPRETKLVDCYHRAYIIVFSSVTETQGLVLLESMVAGTPAVFVAAMGTKDILSGCDGALIANGEIDDFCNKVVSLFNDKKYMARLNRQPHSLIK